jgi:hypothetical protein
MPDEFVDIKIGEVDEAESYQRSGGFLERVYWLSSEPAAEWEAIFREVWNEVDFFPKRHARIENHQLVYVCLETELQGYQMESLIDAVRRTNIQYRKALLSRGES